MGKKKARQARGYAFRVGNGIISRGVVPPRSWDHHDNLVALDDRYGRAGAWVDVANSVFDDVWLREQRDGAHEIARAMAGPFALFAHATRTIAETADLVLAARRATAGSESIVKRIQVHEQYDGAIFEARVARMVAAAALPFRFSPSNGPPAPDLEVGASVPFSIEVKSVSEERRMQIAETLTNLVWPACIALRGSRVWFVWSGDEVQKTRLDELTLPRLSAMAQRVLEVVQARLLKVRSWNSSSPSRSKASARC